MTEKPEIPEAKDPFERRVAITIAIFAAILAFVGVTGDKARLEAQLSATREADQWSLYQSKSLKGHSLETERTLLQLLQPPAVDGARRDEVVKSASSDIERYNHDKDVAQEKALERQKEVDHDLEVVERCDIAGILLQIAIVVASLAILAHWPGLWFLGIALACGGAFKLIEALSLH
jgi:hypothetical protein